MKTGILCNEQVFPFNIDLQGVPCKPCVFSFSVGLIICQNLGRGRLPLAPPQGMMALLLHTNSQQPTIKL